MTHRSSWLDEEIKVTPRGVICATFSFVLGSTYLQIMGATPSWDDWWIYALAPIGTLPGLVVWMWPELREITRIIASSGRQFPWSAVRVVWQAFKENPRQTLSEIRREWKSFMANEKVARRGPPRGIPDAPPRPR